MHITLNPLKMESADHRMLLRRLFNKDLLRMHWKKNVQYRIRDNDTNTITCITLTHDVYPRERNHRISYRVIAPDKIASSRLSDVFAIECTLLFSDENEVEYTEQNLLVLKIIKLDYRQYDADASQLNQVIRNKYEREYKFSRLIPYLAFEPPYERLTNNSIEALLVMKRLPGVELFSIVEHIYPNNCLLASVSKMPSHFEALGIRSDGAFYYIVEKGNNKVIYFVDSDKQSITPLPVKDAMRGCFAETIEQINTGELLSLTDNQAIHSLVEHEKPLVWILSSKLRMRITLALLASLESLVSKQMMHGDLKPENVMTDIGLTQNEMPCHLGHDFEPTKFSVNIIDFDAAQYYGDQLTTRFGTINYRAPEMDYALDNGIDIFASEDKDLYSLGMTLAYLWGFFGEERIEPSDEYYQLTLNEYYHCYFSGDTEFFSKAHFQKIHAIFLKLTDKNPANRGSLRDTMDDMQAIANDMDSVVKLSSELSMLSLPAWDDSQANLQTLPGKSQGISPYNRPLSVQDRKTAIGFWSAEKNAKVGVSPIVADEMGMRKTPGLFGNRNDSADLIVHPDVNNEDYTLG